MIQLTRYLYIKDEVKIALLLSILDKKEESIYWAYEIYYSNDESNEIFDILCSKSVNTVNLYSIT